jgi:hypothetical protein
VTVNEVRKRQTGVGITIRLLLLAAAVWWWSLLLSICSNAPPLNVARRQTIPFVCPVSGLAFITPAQRSLLYGLVPLCVVLVIADALKRRNDRDR